jgi:hypothetical protein
MFTWETLEKLREKMSDLCKNVKMNNELFYHKYQIENIRVDVNHFETTHEFGENSKSVSIEVEYNNANTLLTITYYDWYENNIHINMNFTDVQFNDVYEFINDINEKKAEYYTDYTDIAKK